MATIKDIAKRVGVSMMTVSRALNEPEKVKPETRERIEAVAEELNYYPNNVARSLARKCTKIVFVYIPKGLSATEPFVLQTVTAIGERLGERGYSFLLSRQLPRGESYDGMIMMGMSHDEEKDILGAKKIDKPIVLYGNSDDFESWIDVDNYQGERLAVKYLINNDYKRIAAIAAPQKMHYAEERLKAYKDCLNDYGMEADDNLVAIGAADERGGYECCMRLLDNGSRPDAIACATDSMAIGCMCALKERGLSVPDDVAVVGFDGFGYEKLVSPTLTTVKQPLFEVGVKLADTLVDLVEGGEAKRMKILPKLLIGESV